MKQFNTLVSILVFIFLFSAQRSTATHLDGAEIYHECIGFGKYVVTLELYTDCNSGAIVAPFKQIAASCGAFSANSGTTYILPVVDTIEATPICSSNLQSTWCNGGAYNGTVLYIYRDTIQVSGNLCSDWRFVFNECCRNNAITTIVNPDQTHQFVYTETDLSKTFCNSSPQFGGNMVTVGYIGQPTLYDPKIYDPDGDSLSITLGQMRSNTIWNGVQPTGIMPFASSTPFTIDPSTGLTTYTPVNNDYGVIVYEIKEYRSGILIGTSLKEVAVYHLTNWQGNKAPTYTINNTVGATVSNDSFSLCSGNTLTFDIVVSDSNATDSLVLLQDYITSSLPGATVTATGTNPKTYTVNWTASAGIYRPKFVVHDIRCPYTRSGQLFELYINVEGTNPSLVVSDEYLCSSSPISIQAVGNYANYDWSTGETTSAISVTTAGVYSLTVSGNCGTGVASVEIFDSPEFSVGVDTTISVGDSVQLEALLANGFKTDITIRKDTTIIIDEYSLNALSLDVSGGYPSSISAEVIRKACIDITGDTVGSLQIFLAAPNNLMMPLSLYKGRYGDMQNTCFSPFATDPITNYTYNPIPANATLIPQGSWSTLFGSPTNGEWNLAIQHGVYTGGADTLNSFSLNLGLYEYQWSPSAGLSCDDCPNPIASPDTTTTYVVSMTGTNGCVSYDTITVFVQPRPNAATDTLFYIVAEDSTLSNLCATIPAHMGAATSSAVLCGGVGGLIVPNGISCFDYVSTSSPEFMDTICIEVCDAAGFCDTTVFVITTASCVWAGDTDTNQVVNNFDLLPIGLGMGQTGMVRPNADLNFDCEPNLDWVGATPLSNINYKHSDTDGDGTVTVLDTQAIVQNWGQFYVRGGHTVASNLTPKPFYVDYEQTVPSATIQVPIILGDSLNPVDSAYGVAFTINYDPQYVDTNTVSVLFDNSWMGTINSDMISIAKDFYYQGRIDVGLTRIDHVHRDGFGQLGAIQLTIKDDILKSNIRHLNMHISNVRLITDQEVEIPTNNLPTYILIQLPTGIEEVNGSAGVRIFPNPVRTALTVESDYALEVAQLFSTTGQLLRTYAVSQKLEELSVEQLPAGTYILSVQNAQGRHNQRVTILR